MHGRKNKGPSVTAKMGLTQTQEAQSQEMTKYWCLCMYLCLRLMLVPLVKTRLKLLDDCNIVELNVNAVYCLTAILILILDRRP